MICVAVKATFDVRVWMFGHDPIEKRLETPCRLDAADSSETCTLELPCAKVQLDLSGNAGESCDVPVLHEIPRQKLLSRGGRIQPLALPKQIPHYHASNTSTHPRCFDRWPNILRQLTLTEILQLCVTLVFRIKVRASHCGPVYVSAYAYTACLATGWPHRSS